MRNYLHIFIFLMGVLQATNLQAQTIIIDSLETVIDQDDSTGRARIEAMTELARIMARDKQPENAIDLAKEALRLSESEKDQGYTAISYSTLSYLYAQQDSLNLAYKAMDSAEWYASHTKNTIIKGRVRSQHGWLENLVDNRDKAYKYMLDALRMFEGEDAWLYKSNIYHHLAAIQGYWNEPEKQLNYTKLCLESAKKSKDPDALTNAYLSMGTYYLYQYRKEHVQEQLDSAKFYYSSILKLTASHRERIKAKNIEGIASLNMANLYFEFYPASFKDSAVMYLNNALESGRKSKQAEIIANSYGILSEYALQENNYKKAEDLLQLAMTELVSSSWGSNLSKSRISNALARVAEKSGDTKKALKYYKQYVEYDQELFNEEKHSITQKLEAQYQSDKKELALATMRQEAAYTQKLNNLYLILISIGLVALFFLFRSYHFRLKTAKQKQLLLTGLKNEAELQANLKDEETARLHAERELLQERLDRTEKELLAGSLQVEEKNQLFEDLKVKLDSLDRSDPLYKQINRLLSRNYEVDRGYDDIKTELTEIRPEFIEGLQKKSGNKLTRLDLKYCSYILMGLTNKEIAIKLNVDPKSIRMARYRIKQKLQLGKDQSLDHFINTLVTKQG